MKGMLVLALAATLLTGCVYQQHGNRFDVDAAKALQPGISTEDDAVAKLGKPSAISNMANGSQLLQWQYVFGTAVGVGGGAHAAILFGPDRKMIRITHISER
jgi:hypothetical protein